jgi:UDP-GlcNAc:undecaprenyl-phosphate GlcNAc-1-phosphate transferase
MPPAWIAAPVALLFLVLGDLCNRRLRGFLPDDPPGEGRKRHHRPMSLQGVLLAPVLLWPLLDARHVLLACAVALSLLVGFCDDRRKQRGEGVDWRLKATGLGLAALTVAWVAAPPGLRDPGTILALALLAFALVNATNFLDNTDGVAAALSATALLLLTGGQGPLAWAGFAALGFLPWNWPRPRAFLGDAGAYGLGVCVAAAVLPHLGRPEAALLPVVVQLADFVQVVTARIWLGLPPWIGDRRHLTHILHTNLGVRRVLVAPVLAAATVGLWAWLGR